MSRISTPMLNCIMIQLGDLPLPPHMRSCLSNIHSASFVCFLTTRYQEMLASRPGLALKAVQDHFLEVVLELKTSFNMGGLRQ